MSLWPQDWPPVTMPAGPQHTSFSAISLQSPVHPLFLLLPRKATTPGLWIWLELGSRKGRVCGQKAKAMVGMKMWRHWERWIKTHRKMSAFPGGEGFGSSKMSVLQAGEDKTVNGFSVLFLWSRPTRDSFPSILILGPRPGVSRGRHTDSRCEDQWTDFLASRHLD